MKIRTFWTILLKILGIFLALKGVNVLIYLINSSFIYLDWDIMKDWEAWLATIVSLVFAIGIYFFILWLFVFKTSWLIDKLHLEKGFNEEKIDLNIQLSTILKVATIVLGGIMIISSLPQLCKHAFTFFQESVVFRQSPTVAWIIVYLVEVIIGYLLMTSSKTIVNFIIKHSAKNDENENQ